MNLENLSKVRDRIAEVGVEHCFMGTYAIGEVSASGEPDCGTSACIAGWALAVKNGSFVQKVFGVPSLHYANEAAVFLGFAEENNLFWGSKWPARYLRIATAEGDGKAMLQILDDLISGLVDQNLDETSR